MGYKASNFASSVLAVSLGGTVGDTTLQISAGDIAKFPVINDGGVGSDFTMLVLTDSAKNLEVVKVTRHDTGSISFTIERAQEDTTARIWQPGDSVSLRLTAGVVTQTYTHPSQATGAHAATAVSVAPAGNIASTNVQAALEELDSEKSPTGHTHAASAITVTPAGSIASTTVQGALQELDSEKASTADIANMLETADIGFTVQAYDVDTAKLDVDQSWTGSQRGAVTTDNDLSFDMAAANNFACTPTAGGTLTFTNITAGQSGFIKLVNGSNYAIAAHANTKISAASLSRISATGTYILSYFSDGTNVFVVTSESLA